MRLLITGVCLVGTVIAGAVWLAMLGSSPERSPSVSPQLPLVAADSSGFGHDGVNQGRPVVGAEGRDGSTAYSFGRDGSWIQVPSTPRLNPQGRDFLYSAWTSFTSPPPEGETYDIIRKGLAFTSGGEFKLEVISSGRVKCSAKDSAGAIATVLGPELNAADGRWHHIGCARTGTVWSALVDDTVVSKTVALGRVANTVGISIGSKYGREDGVPGRVDEVRLYIAAPGEVRAPSPVRDVRLRQLRRDHAVGVWHLDEVETPLRGTTQADQSR